ncbi:MAG: 3-keto-5-aminohexanoate cleavage protein [Alphaproteobacteria bacterium]
MTKGWDKLIVTVAPNGARRTKRDHPALPLTPDEIARTAAACREAGAAMLHLHVRDKDGRHSLDVEAYREAIAAVRRAVGDGLIIQATTEAAGRYGPAEQMAAMRALRPEATSLALREIVPDAQAERKAARFFAWLEKEQVVPQFILYSADELARYQDLRTRGVIPGARHFLLFVLGRYDTAEAAKPAELLPFLAALGDDGPWAVCAFGARENACALAAAALGGHLRVGFENNLYLCDRSPAPTNAALVEQAAVGAVLIGRELADADAARAMLSVATG